MVTARVRRADGPVVGYGTVLLLIILSMVLVIVAQPGSWQSTFSVVVRGAALVVVAAAAGLRHRLVVALTAIVLATVAGSIGWVVGDAGSAAQGSPVVAGLLAAAAAVLVVRDLARHVVVTGQTVLGALSVYLLLALVFASLFGVIAELGPAPMFTTGDGTPRDHLYFSLITQTTVGYGDLVPGSDVARISAALEALLGQLYLVTVVALVVSRVGHERRRFRGDRDDPDGRVAPQGRSDRPPLHGGADHVDELMTGRDEDVDQGAQS